MHHAIRKFMKRRLGCQAVNENFRFCNVGFDVVGYSSADSVVHVVECKAGNNAVQIGHAFGQLLAYKSVLTEKGYEFLTEFGDRARMRTDDIVTATQEGSLRVKFYVGLTDEACRNVSLIRAMKESLPSVGVFRVKKGGGCRLYLRIKGEKDYELCKSQTVSVPVRRVYDHRNFLQAVERRLRDNLAGSPYTDFKTYALVDKPYGDYQKFWFGRKVFHFEILLRKRKFIEVALHLEGGRSDNISLFREFKKRQTEIENALGKGVKISKWGKQNWRHVYEHLPRTDLTDEQARNVAEKMAAYIRVLQPMLERWESKQSVQSG